MNSATKPIVIDAVGALTRDAAARVVGAYQAGAYEASSSHFQRFMSLWSIAISRKAEAR